MTLDNPPKSGGFFIAVKKRALGTSAPTLVPGTTLQTTPASQPRPSRSREPGLNLLRIEESLSAAHLRLANTYIEHLPWDECVRRYDRPHTLFYLDPPYWQTAGYGPEFGWDQFELMAKLLRKIQGKAIISLNDHPDIRACFEGYHFESTDIRYTVGSGKGAEAKEVLIFNWNIEEEPAGLF